MSEGFRNDEGKPRIDLVPVEAIRAIARVFTRACESGIYPERNWEKGMDWHRVYNSMQRHAMAWLEGEELDIDGYPHIEKILTNAAMLLTYVERGIGNDTRPNTKRT